MAAASPIPPDSQRAGKCRFALGSEFKKIFSQLIEDTVNRLWAMRDLDQEITALNNRRPFNAANAAGVRFLDFVPPAFYEKVSRYGRVSHAWVTNFTFAGPHRS